jgi:hypothetical protein
VRTHLSGTNLALGKLELALQVATFPALARQLLLDRQIQLVLICQR